MPPTLCAPITQWDIGPSWRADRSGGNHHLRERWRRRRDVDDEGADDDVSNENPARPAFVRAREPDSSTPPFLQSPIASASVPSCENIPDRYNFRAGPASQPIPKNMNLRTSFYLRICDLALDHLTYRNVRCEKCLAGAIRHFILYPLPRSLAVCDPPPQKPPHGWRRAFCCDTVFPLVRLALNTS